MLPGSDDDVKVPGWASVLPGIALAWNPDPLPVTGTRLNAHFEGFGPRHRALTVARWTDRYILARPVAPGTLHIELHAAAGLRDLPGSVALRTLARRFQEALPVTIRTDILARNIEAHDPAPDCRPERDVDLVLQVRARLRPGLRRSATAPATEDPGKDIFKATAAGAAGPPAAPRIFEHVGEAEPSAIEVSALTAGLPVSAPRKTARRESARPAAGPRVGFCRGTICMVGVEADLGGDLALLGIAQNVVGFGQGLELLLSPFVPRVNVRMVLPRQFAERLADFLRRGALLHAQNLVIVLLGGGGHVEVKRSPSRLCPLIDN